jgi:TolB-like protein
MIVRFGSCTLDTDRRELDCGGARVHLEPQVFDLLAYLIANRERVVGKDELIRAIWQGRIVSDATLATRINAARRAIGDTGKAQALIRTIPKRGFRFLAELEPEPATAAPAPLDDAPPALPDRPSIAVLAFETGSSGAAQEYFADGMADEIVTALSRLRSLFVVAGNSSFAYRGRAVDVRQVGRDLGVRYILTGSVRRDGERLRATTQLVEAATGGHLWAETYEGRLAQVFDLQDRIAAGVAAAIEPALHGVELERSRRKRPQHLDAYDLYLRALPRAGGYTPEEAAQALQHIERALAIDPNYGPAHALAAWCHHVLYARATLDPDHQAAAVRHARLVLASGTDDARALATAAFILAIEGHELDAARAALDHALAINPNSALALGRAAQVCMFAGDYAQAIDAAGRAIRLSPLDPLRYVPEVALAFSYFLTGEFAQAAAAALRAA